MQNKIIKFHNPKTIAFWSFFTILLLTFAIGSFIGLGFEIARGSLNIHPIFFIIMGLFTLASSVFLFLIAIDKRLIILDFSNQQIVIKGSVSNTGISKKTTSFPFHSIESIDFKSIPSNAFPTVNILFNLNTKSVFEYNGGGNDFEYIIEAIEVIIESINKANKEQGLKHSIVYGEAILPKGNSL